jgi:hypothetical protein
MSARLYTPAQLEKAKGEGHVLFSIRFDFRSVPQERAIATSSLHHYGTMSLERMMRIREILNEDEG